MARELVIELRTLRSRIGGAVIPRRSLELLTWPGDEGAARPRCCAL